MRKPKIISTLQEYSWTLFVSDLIAGASVAMVALPLSLAIAIASGAQPVDGLITAIVGGFFISLVGGSRVQIGGPTGAFIVVVFSTIADHGYDGLVLATLMAGIILIIAGYFRLGRLIAYVPESVVNGFTIGIGVIIGTSQLKDLFGLSFLTMPNGFLETVAALWAAKGGASIAAFAVAIMTMILIIGFRRAAPKLPGLIVAISLIAFVVAWAQLPVETIFSRFGELPTHMPLPHLPDISYARVVELFPVALVIAFLAGVESLLSALVADRMIGGAHRPNAEVLAQGVANVASALFGGMPATGAIARTATNVQAGGRTPVAGLFHAIVVLLVMLFLGAYAGYLPMPALAGLLLITAWNMSEPHKWKMYWGLSYPDRFLLLLTCVLTVLVDLTVAIGVGVVLGLAMSFKQRIEKPKDWHTPEH